MSKKTSWRDYSSYMANDGAKDGETGGWGNYSSENSSSSWRNYSKLGAPSAVANDIYSSVTDLLKKHNSFVSSYEKRYANRQYNYDDAYVSDAENWWESLTDQRNDFNTEANNILSYVEQNSRYLDKDWVEEVKKTISDAKSAQKKIRNAAENDYYYWSQWDSEDAYNAAIKQAKDDEKRWNELSGGYDPTKNQAEGKAGWEDYVATQERHTQQAEKAKKEEEEKPWYEKLLGYLGDVGPDTSLPVNIDVNEMAQGYQEQSLKMRHPDDRWTDEQRETFGYLWNTERQKAYDYAFAVNNMLNVQAETAKVDEIKAMSTDNAWAGAAHTAGAILTAPLGLADYLGDVIAYGSVGYVPQADGELTPFEYSQAVTGGITENLNKYGTLNENIPIIGGKGWGDAYGLGTSILQSSAAAYSGGSAQALISFFGSAAASGVDDAVSRGATGEQALLYGSAVGAAEALAEMIGIDNLMKIGSSNTVKQLLVNLLKQSGAEGLEEGVTNFLGNVADNAIMRDKSNFYLRAEAYMNAGVSEEEAKRKAWGEMWGDMAFDMLGGFVSGGIHAGPQTAYKTYISR